MSRALEGLYGALRPLRLYALRQESLIDCELAAYDAAFSVLEERLEALSRTLFPQTAAGAALGRYEAMLGLVPRDALEDVDRRRLLLYRLGSAPFDFHREGMVNSIRAAGMEAALLEHPAEEALTVRCLGIVDRALDLDRLKASVHTVLPAHLEAEFDIGNLTWDLFEQSGASWDGWDATGMTWNDFDLAGDAIFPPMGGA